MKKVAISFLILFYVILLISLVLLTLILIELNTNGSYYKDLLASDFNLSLIIVLPPIAIQIFIFVYIKKKNIKIFK